MRQRGNRVKVEVTSASEGGYAIPALLPGSYTLTVSATGFRTYVRRGIEITANQRMGLDITLEVGNIADSVTVTAESPALQTATASTGQVINSLEIANMPVNGRTPLVLAQMAFGVVPSGQPAFVRPFDNGGPSSFSMAGAPVGQNELLLDGAPDTGSGGNVAYNPPVDAVTELKVESFQADAAYGHTGGGTVNVILKSGSNGLHGTAYEFNQVSRLAATSFFVNRSGQKKSVTRYNQWGFTNGGPVYIPKVIDGRNKVFFYFAYEGVRDGLPRVETDTVPTAAEIAGDFSQLLKIGSQYQLYDPYSSVAQGSRIARQPLANNIIPPSRINAIAKKLLQLYPAPNNPAPADGQNNYVPNRVERNYFHNVLARVDWNTNRQRIYGNFRTNARTSLDNKVVENTTAAHRINWGGMIDDVVTVTPATLVDLRLNFTRWNENRFADTAGYDIVGLGFPAPLAATSPHLKMPTFSPSGYTTIAADNDYVHIWDTYQIFLTLTRTAGPHSLKFGSDMRLSRQIAYDYGNSAGSYSFSTSWNKGPLDTSANAPLGQGLAAFLYGLPTGGGFDLNASRVNQAGYYALFAQDDIRVRADLTLNLGLRYERDLPTRERFAHAVNGFDFNSPSPISAAAVAAYAKSPIPEITVSQFRVPGGLTFASPSNPDIYRTGAHYFSPRLGFAWKPAALGSKLVLRGGFGVYMFAIGTTGVYQNGYSQTTSLVPTLDGYLTPYATLVNPFPDGIQQPAGSSLGLATYLGQSVTFFNPNPLNAYTLRWTFNVQRELPGKITAELGYEGDHAVHLPGSKSLDFTPGQYYSTLPTRDQTAINFLSANVTNPFAGLIPGTTLNGSTISRSQLLTPYPEFTGVTEANLNEAGSYFHELGLRVERRFSGGLQVLGNFQFSKLISRTSRLNAFDSFLEKRVGSEDRPKRLVISATYELPFGRGKRFASGANMLANAMIGGWMINENYARQSGSPLSWGNVIYYGGDLHLDPRALAGAFDTTRFNTVSAQQLSSNVRTFPSAFGNLRGDGVNNLDLSLIKEFSIREKATLQYRFEAFNALNHPVFGGPNTSPTSSAFATISSQANSPRAIQMALRMVW